jgi:hypothetical protein
MFWHEEAIKKENLHAQYIDEHILNWSCVQMN